LPQTPATHAVGEQLIKPALHAVGKQLITRAIHAVGEQLIAPALRAVGKQLITLAAKPSFHSSSAQQFAVQAFVLGKNLLSIFLNVPASL
jgi:hypothetical protein